MIFMKKAVLVLVALILSAFSACGNAGPLDLTGDWKQSNPVLNLPVLNSNYQIATIGPDSIEIYWYNDDTEIKALYWAGSYTPPTKAVKEYTWDSVNDKEKTGESLLATGDETKTFTYKDGVISYDVSALGLTQTVKLKRV